MPGKYVVLITRVIVEAVFVGGLVLALRPTPAAERGREGDLTPGPGDRVVAGQ